LSTALFTVPSEFVFLVLPGTPAGKKGFAVSHQIAGETKG